MILENLMKENAGYSPKDVEMLESDMSVVMSVNEAVTDADLIKAYEDLSNKNINAIYMLIRNFMDHKIKNPWDAILVVLRFLLYLHLLPGHLYLAIGHLIQMAFVWLVNATATAVDVKKCIAAIKGFQKELQTRIASTSNKEEKKALTNFSLSIDQGVQGLNVKLNIVREQEEVALTRPVAPAKPMTNMRAGLMNEMAMLQSSSFMTGKRTEVALEDVSLGMDDKTYDLF